MNLSNLLPSRKPYSFTDAQTLTDIQSDETFDNTELETMADDFIADINRKCGTIYPYIMMKIATDPDVPIDEQDNNTFFEVTLAFDYTQYIPFQWFKGLSEAYFGWKVLFREGDSAGGEKKFIEYEALIKGFLSEYETPTDFLDPDSLTNLSGAEYQVNSPYLNDGLF